MIIILERRIVLAICLIVGFIVHYYIEKPICEARLKPKDFFIYVAVFYFCITSYSFTIKESQVRCILNPLY